MQNNIIALIITFAVALIWLRLNDFVAHRGWVSGQLSRKIIHIGTGPLYVVCWLLFSDVLASRFLAALVPFSITLQFILVGTGVVKDDAAVKAMSRTGDRLEILKGPLFYGLVFVFITLLYWLNSPIGIVALMLLCGGDGLAEILGRRFGVIRLPWSKDKSWVGSFGMFIGGWFLAVAVMAIYVSAGEFPAPLSNYLVPLTITALVATIVESLPISDIDNITITVAALIAGHLVF